MSKHKVLIVDDDRDISLGLNARLAANGFETVSAMDGMSATRMALKEKPDVILLDLGLPAGDGFVVLERLRENAQLMNTPVIVLTARDPQEAERRAIEAGAAAFFQKPVDNDELLATIRHALGL